MSSFSMRSFTTLLFVLTYFRSSSASSNHGIGSRSSRRSNDLIREKNNELYVGLDGHFSHSSHHQKTIFANEIASKTKSLSSRSIIGKMKDDYNDYVDVMLKTKPRRRPQPQQQHQEYDIQTYESSKSSDISTSVAAGAYVSKDMWSKLVLDDLNKRNVIYQLSKTALELCEKSTYPNLTWKPDKATAEILNKYGSMESSSLSDALRSVDDNTALPEDTILVWTAKFNSDTNAYGVDLPIIRTRGIVNGMSPQKITNLLMDSSKVKLYNKISLGRTDQEVYQEGINVVDQYGDKYGHGESKIVFNLTKPPIVKKQMVFR